MFRISRALATAGLLRLVSTLIVGCSLGFLAQAQPAADTLPARWVSHQYLPAVGNQGDQEICVLYHTIYYQLTWAKAKEHGWYHPDPAVNPERVMDWHFGQFTHTRLERHGCATYADTASGFNETDWPTRAQWQAALRNRTAGREMITVNSAASALTLKAKLAANNVGLWSLDAATNFHAYGSTPEPAGVNNAVYFSDFDQSGVAHALTIIGYDDAKAYVDDHGVSHTGAFLAVNSWGQSWGVSIPEVGTRGFVWLAYDFVIQQGLGVEFMINRPEETPTALAIVEWEHPQSEQVHLQLLAGRPQAPAWSLDFSVNRPWQPVHTEIALDISVPYAQGILDYWVRGFTYDVLGGGAPANGTVLNFALELPAAPQPWICNETPLQLRASSSMTQPQFQWLKVGLLTDEPLNSLLPILGATRQVWGNFAGEAGPLGVLHGELPTDTGFTYPTYVLEPDHAGSVRTRDAGLPAVEMALTSGDLDGDGRTDLLTHSLETGELQAWSYSRYDGRFHAMALALPTVELGRNGAFSLVDFNNDGRLDLATLPIDADDDKPSAFRLWLRQADGGFVESPLRLDLRQSPNYDTAMAWDDVDGDGWSDVALTATAKFHDDYFDLDYWSNCVVILRNTAGSGLVEYGRGPTGYEPRGNMAFGDANNDGLPDLALSNINMLLLNRGAGVFERLDLGLDFYDRCRLDWVDLDQDGWMDLLATGDRGTVRDYYTVLWHNRGDGTFASALGTVPGLWYGSLGQVDLDDDGDLDLVASGWIEAVACWPERERVLRIFRNRTAQQAGYGRVNQPPSPPAGLSALGEAGGIRLQWPAALDDLTPAAALRYHLRIETVPGWGNLTSPAWSSDALANRGAGRAGTAAGVQQGALVTQLPAGTCYASIQTIDGAGARSGWSDPITIGGGTDADACDVNRDGQIDVADAVACLRLAHGQPAPAGAKGDVNADGATTELDATHVINRLQGTPMPGRETVALCTIGPAGGEINADGFQLKIGTGQFSEPTQLSLFRFDADRPGEMLSPLFRLTGLPETGLTSFTLRIRTDGALGETPLLAYGMNGWRTSGGESALGIGHYKPLGREGAWLSYAVQQARPATPDAAPTTKATATGPLATWGVVEAWWGVSGKLFAESEHFITVFPETHDSQAVLELIGALEAAYTRTKDSLGFSFAAMPSSKIQVEVLPRGANEFGSFLDLPGRDFDKLEFNSKDVVKGNAQLVPTAQHEFLHCVVSQYVACIFSGLYWINEASAVWSETKAVPGQLPSVFDENAGEMIKGLQAGASGNQEKHGYGTAAALKYLEMKSALGDKAPAKLWLYLSQGYRPPEAMRLVLGATGYTWWTELMEAHVNGSILGYATTDVDRDAPLAQTFDPSTYPLDMPMQHSAKVPDLGAHLYQFIANSTALPADAVVSHRLLAPEHVDLLAFHHYGPLTTTKVGMGSKANGRIKIDVPLAGWGTTGRDRALALLCNRQGNAQLDYGDPTAYEFSTAVTWNRTHAILAAPAVNANVYGAVPAYSVTGTLSGPGLTRVVKTPLTNINGLGDSVGTLVKPLFIGMPPATLEIDLNAVASRTQAQVSEDGLLYDYNASGIKAYTMDVQRDPTFRAAEVHSESADGRFSIPIGTDDTFISCSFQVRYDVTITSTLGGSSSTRTDYDRTTNIGVLYVEF